MAEQSIEITSQSASLSEILSELETKSAPESDRKHAYAKFSRHFSTNEVSLFSLDVAKNVNHVIDVILQDVGGNSTEVCQEALQVLGVCLHDQDIVRNVTAAVATEVIKKLCACILKTEDKTTCTRALWCLGKQNMPAAVIQNQVDVVLTAVDFAMEKWTGNSITVEHECVNTIARLAEQTPREMSQHTARWGKILLPLVAHTAIKVRKRVLDVIESRLEMLLANQRELLAASLVPIFKNKVCSELKKLLAAKQEIYVLKCWGFLVQIFGEELHRGTFTNTMLPIIELGFKSAVPEIKMAAFTAWQYLIDCFATNPSIIGDQKRIKLVMQVFKINNARTEEVAQVKFNVWWHFIWLLGNKVSANFDMVAAPMLQFCIGGSKLTGDHNMNTTPRVAQNGISPVTPKMNLTCPNTQWQVFKFLQLKGCEVLAHFLGSRPQEVELPNYHFSLDHLRCEVISGPAMFVKNASLLITAAIELFISLGKDVPESLLFHIWYSLVAHMKNAIEGVAKLDMREIVIMFLKQFQVLVLSRVLSNSVVLKLFEGVCCLPKKVLCSSAYNIGGGEMIHGTPALFLMEMLLTPALLQSGPQLEKYHTLYSTIINSGLHNSSGSLGFLQGIMQLLEQNASFVENSEMLWRFWSAVVQPLQEHITKTNEINQGDSLEHNFSCVYQALLFPLNHKLPTSVPQPTVKTLTRTWTELYKTVNRLAAMVTNAEANIVCEDVCQKILELNKGHENLEPLMLEFEINTSHVIISSLDFSSLGGQTAFGLSASPAKWLKKRQKVLENIHSLVFLLNNLQNKLTCLVADTESDAKSFQKSSVDKVPLQGMLNMMVDNFSTLFTHVTSSTIISSIIGCLAQPIGELYQDVAKKTAVKVYNNAFQQKMEKLWMDITTCLQSRYQSVFDSEFLLKLSPLLEATFLHSRRQIKNQTLALWNVTFGKAASLHYPDGIRPVLSKVKEKSAISLPGWVSVSVPVIEETPISQMSQSQAPEPHIPGMPSPHKLHGSFLNKAVSPNVKKSPAKVAPSPRANSAKKKVLGFNSLDEKEFVVIQSSPRKPKVLTEHQKEVMKERKILPAMYNTLEISQDVSMMAHFNTETQDGSQSQTPTPTLDQPFSLFGSVIPSSVASNKQKNDEEKIKSPEVTEPISKRMNRTGFKSPEVTKKGSPPTAGTSSEPTPTRRRSVRFKDDEKMQNSMQTKDSDVTSTNKKGKKGIESDAKSTADSNQINTDTRENSAEKSIEVVNNDGEVDKKDSAGKTEVTTGKSGSITVSPEKTLGLKQAEVVLEKCDSQKSTDKTTDSSKSKSDESSESENEKRAGSQSDKGLSLSSQSIPQNVLGALGPTPESSSKSSESKMETVTTTDKDRKDLDQDDESQPLFSWTQKLNQLNKSPRSQSPLRKVLSPDGKTSPLRTRSQSPLKSPKRAKKKLTDESYGNLDKWIIRSPGKNATVEQTEKNIENIMTVGSTTFVEETQSPTKFTKNKLDGDHKNDSVMETPPKQDFTNSSVVGFANSNRKLFQGSQENIENMHDILEDSNIIAASPNAKSFKPGSPFLKLTRLTDSEIRKYSPGKDGKKELNFTPTKADTVLTILDQGQNSLHKHDDFSGFRPLETYNQNKTEKNGFFSKSLTDTDRTMLKLNGDEKPVDSDSERMDISQSDSELPEESQASQNAEIKGLFSQIVKEAKREAEMFANDTAFEPSADIFTQESETAAYQPFENSQASQNETKSLDETQDSPASQNETQSQDETQEFQNDTQPLDETQDSQEKVVKTPRGRKRKQETPKKTTPDAVKKDRRKKFEENSQESQISNIGSAKKISKRLQEKRERKEVNKQSQTSSPPDSKRVKRSSVTKHITEDLETKDKRKSSSQDKNIESIKTRKSLNASSSKKCLEHTETESIVKEKPVTEINEQEPSSVAMKQNVKYDECGNIINLENEQKNQSNDEGQQNTTGLSETVEKACIGEKKNHDKIEITKESESAENDNKLETNRKKGSKKDLKPLKKKLSSSQEEKLQKTPENRNSAEQPERKSTTKKRKEVAQKRVFSRGKDVVVNDSDSNLDQDLSDEDLPLSLHVAKKPVAENLEKKIHKQLSDENKTTVITGHTKESDKSESVEVDNENNEDNVSKVKNENIETEEHDITAMDISFCSDDIPLSSLKSSQDEQEEDDIPLSNLKSSQEETKEKNENKIETETDNKEEKDKANESAQKVTRKQKQNRSPINNKLRSGTVKTRLRSGEKKPAASQGKNKLSLASKRVNNAKKKLNIGVKKKNESGLDVAEIENDATVIEVPGPNQIAAVVEKPEKVLASKETVEKTNLNTVGEAVENVLKEQSKGLDIGPQTDGFAGMKDESTSTAGASRPINPVFDILDETPTKVKESPKRLTASILIGNSDSKLILGSRKFDKRSSLARRSILKPSSLGSPSVVNSPKRDFHPIKLPRIYSPTASPSASILKKRRLSDDPTSDTNSPPSKQRRVSFAEPLAEAQAHSASEIVVPQPEPAVASATPQVDKSNIPATQKPDVPAPVPTELSETQSTSGTPNPSTYQSTQATPTPNTYQSTQESQLDDSQAVFPELMDCEVSIEKILPQLTSSMWSRGLGQLVRARNIHTIGHLSALTEAEIDGLPIKAPKVLTVKKVLSSFSETQQAKKSKSWKSPKNAPKTLLLEEDPIPVNDATKTAETQNETADQLSTDVEKILASSGNLVDEVNRLSQKMDQSEEGKESHDTLKDQSGTVQQTCDLQCAQSKFREFEDDSTEEVGQPTLNSVPLLKNISECMSSFSLENMRELGKNELCQLQQDVANFQNKLTSVFMARCHSPPP